MKDNYKILGLERGASRDEIETAYASLRNKYKEDRFLEGEAGNEAARKLSELDEAYADVVEELSREEAKTDFGSSLGDVDKMIRDGNYDKAQACLDDISERSAEWHYLQSIIYYKRNWYLESRKQLEFAVRFEPNNEKYKGALSRLDGVMAAPVNPNEQTRANPSDMEQGVPSGNDCGACCTSLCIADCCCRMLTCCS